MYTIVSGDAWSSIASRAKVTMKALLAANNATVNTMLHAGQDHLPPGRRRRTGPADDQAAIDDPAAVRPRSRSRPRRKPTKPPAPRLRPPRSRLRRPNTYTKAQVAQIIRDVWPDDLEDEAIRIATRESNLIPTVRNSCCYGLFQIYYTVHRTWLASIGVTSAAQLYDPHVNASAALALYNKSGWGPWGVSSPTTTAA